MTTLKKLQRQLYNKQLFLLSLNLGCFEDKDYYTNWYEEQLQKFEKYKIKINTDVVIRIVFTSSDPDFRINSHKWMKLIENLFVDSKIFTKDYLQFANPYDIRVVNLNITDPCAEIRIFENSPKWRYKDGD